jgi:hypothetical protein
MLRVLYGGILRDGLKNVGTELEVKSWFRGCFEESYYVIKLTWDGDERWDNDSIKI